MSRSLSFFLSYPITQLNLKSRMGKVNLDILASTNSHVANEIHKRLSRTPSGDFEKRGLFSSIGHALKQAAETVKDGVDNAANKVKDGTEDAVNKVKDVTEDAVNKAKVVTEDAANKVIDGVVIAANKTEGVIDKIKEGGQKAVDAIKAVPGEIVDGIDNADNCACVTHNQWCYFLTVHPGLENHTGFDLNRTLATPPIHIHVPLFVSPPPFCFSLHC